MPLAKNIMGGGTAAGAADAFDTPSGTLTAAGTTQATALLIKADINVLGTTATAAGVIFFNGQPGDSMIVYNGGANTCIAYPPVGAFINARATNSGFPIGAGGCATFWKVAALQWISNLSA